MLSVERFQCECVEVAVETAGVPGTWTVTVLLRHTIPPIKAQNYTYYVDIDQSDSWDFVKTDLESLNETFSCVQSEYF